MGHISYDIGYLEDTDIITFSPRFVKTLTQQYFQPFNRNNLLLMMTFWLRCFESIADCRCAVDDKVELVDLHVPSIKQCDSNSFY